ncbi:MAG: tetratricopeptide repeat protein [Kiritimatiellia bacterium]
MNSAPFAIRKRNAAAGDFQFFRPDLKHSPGEGRDPRVQLDKDPLAQQFPTDRQTGWFLFLASFLLYLATMSWQVFPGPPTWALLAHLDPTAAPTSRDAVWGWLMKGFAGLSAEKIAVWSGLFSALCAAGSVALLARLMMRAGYLIRNEPGRESFFREAQARRISGLVAGAYLAFSLPVWVAATRSMPDPFHLLLLLVFAWFISQYRHRGQRRHLFFAGWLFGAGAAEYPTFLIFFPLAAFILLREIFRWQALRAWRTYVALLGGLALGLSLYPLIAFVLFKQQALAGTYIPPWEALRQTLSDQFQLATQLRFAPGFLVIVAVPVVPWLTLFPLSSRSPWFYEWGQISVRGLFAAGMLGVLFDLPFAPWRLMGFGYLMTTPYVILAICMGYVAGEFWILGEPQVMLDTDLFKRTVRRFSGLLALLLPVAILGIGASHWRTVDGRYGRIADQAVAEVLGRLEGRNILFTTGLLDESLALAVVLRDSPVRVISAPRTGSGPYLQRLAKRFSGEPWQRPLAQGDFGKFLDHLLMSDDGPGLIGIIDLPDVFREFGYLVPDGFLYRMEIEPGRIDLSALIAAQQPFWAWLEQMAAQPVPEKNLLRLYQDRMRLMASKVANNLAVLQLERGDEAGGAETLRTARRIYRENWSVLMNLLELGRTQAVPDLPEWEAEWTDRVDELGGDRWALAVRFGYVWRARNWVQRGHVWALSGVPAVDEALRRKPAISDEEDAANDNRIQILDQAYLLWGQPMRDDTYYRGQLVKDGRDVDALMAMGRLAMRRNDPEAAEAFYAEALAMGLTEKKMLFDRAMLTYVRGENEAALRQLADLSRQTPGDLRVWMALVLLADENDPLSIEALKRLKGYSGAPLGVHLALGYVYMGRQQWAAAQSELDLAVQQDPRNAQAWEMMVLLAQTRGNKPLLEAGLRALMERNPDHFLQYQNAGVEAYRRGNLEEAESSFRNGLLRQRDATLLNNLAHVLMERDGDLPEALKLVDEALLRQPGQAQMLSTRGAISVKLGRFEEARKDLQDSLRKQGRTPNLLLLLAQTYEGLGDRTRALTLVRALAAQPGQMDAQQERLMRELLARLENEPTARPAADAPPDAELARVEMALRAKPGDAELLGRQGEILFRMGRHAEARSALAESIRQQGRNEKRLLLLAESSEKIGDRARALAIAKALAAQPERLDAGQKNRVKDLLLRVR